MKYYEANLREDKLDDQAIGWEMDEYLNHKRGATWYFMLSAIAISVALLVYFATGRELIAPVSIIVLAACLITFSFKKPKRRKYTLSSLGIKIGSRLYNYASFKNFSLIKEGGLTALYLASGKMFAPPLTIYLPSDRDHLIVKTLSRYIAYAPKQLQWSDRFLQFFRI